MKKLLLLILVTCFSQGIFANATVAQKEWRWRNDNGSESTATWINSQDAGANVGVCLKDTVRLRIGFQVNPDPSTTNPASKTVGFQISYASSPSGPWTPISTNPASAFMLVSSSFVSDGMLTSNQLTHSSSGTYASGQIIDETHSAGIVFATPAGVTTLTEHEWVIAPTANATAGTYYFSLEGLNSYPNPLPTFTLVGGPNTSSQTVTGCDSYTTPSGDNTYTASGTYTETQTNMYGCDSVITYNVTVNSSTSGSMNVTACDSYTFSGTTFTGSGAYSAVITNMAGCDSVVTINLTINNSSSSTMNVTSCDSYTFPDGTSTSASGVYTIVVPNMAGCDSTITMNLTINTVDASVMASGLMITANNITGTYQWVDCNNSNAPIAGETNQSFTATTNGNYAVIVTDNGCSAMSPCTMISTVGISNNVSSMIQMYPNPSNGLITIITSGKVSVEIRNALGQIVVTKVINGTELIDMTPAGSGMFSVLATDEAGNVSTQRIVVSK